MRKIFLIMAVLLGVTVAAYAAGTANSIVVGLSADVNNWHAGWHNGSIEEGLVENIYENLFMFDRNANSVPALAVSYKNISPLVWEFKLRPNVKFTNGEPFNAASAKWSLETQRDDPKVTSRSWLATIKEVKVVDDLTIHIYTKNPDPELINELTWAGEQMPLKYGKEEYNDRMINEPVGTGPYKLVEWKKDVKIVLEYNENWWGPKPDVRRVEIRPIPEPSTRAAALISGEVDFIDNPQPEDVPRISATKGLSVETTPSQRVVYLFMDSYRSKGGAAPEGSPGLATGEKNPLLDVRVRKALYQAIDREMICQQLHQGLASPAYQPMIPSSKVYVDVTPPKYDPETAKKLLAEAGYPNGFKLNISTMNDRLPHDKDTVLVVASQFKKIGVDATVYDFPKTIIYAAYAAYDMTIGLQTWGALTMPGMSWRGLFYANDAKKEYGQQNHGRYINAQMNSTLDKLAVEFNETQRLAYFTKLTHDFMDQIPILPIYYVSNVRAMKDDIQFKVYGVEQIHYRNMVLKK